MMGLPVGNSTQSTQKIGTQGGLVCQSLIAFECTAGWLRTAGRSLAPWP